MSDVGLTEHITVDGLRVDEDDWSYVVCKCGWSSPPMPDLETLIDEVMMHVSLAVQTKARKWTVAVEDSE